MSRLVLLSGWGLDARIWRPLREHWPAGPGASHPSVTTPDWPGYGGQPPLAAPHDLDALARAMKKALPANAIWVGWSLGALLAAAMAERLPPPRALVALAMTPRFAAPTLDEFRHAFQRAPERTWRHFLRLQTSGEPRPRTARQRLRQLVGETPGADRDTLAAGLDQLAALRIGQLPCPLIALRGEHDPLLPPPSAVQRPLSCGHCPQLSIPAQLAERLREIAHDLG